MIRTDVYLTETQIEKLNKDRNGKSRSELLRRIIDHYYESKDKKESVSNDNN